MATNVKKLEESVQSQLRSDLTTHSITNCVIELVENAIDAQSTSIAIRINLQKFQLEVIDDGAGMTREQLKTVGKRHCTSKWNSKSTSTLFGYRGETLANLRKSCNRLLIITRTAQNETTFCKEFNNDGTSRVEEALQARISKGTTVIVKNVLGKTPVRQARITPSVEFQNIKQYVRATAIMHPMICFSLEDSSKSVELLRIKRAKTTQKQMKNLYPEIYDGCTMLKFVSENGQVRVRAIVSDRMCKFKTVQFFYVNKRYIAKSDMEKFFKKFLQKCFRDTKAKEALEVRSRWQPVFVLNITCPKNYYYVLYELNKRCVEFKNRHVVKNCLVELLNQFRRTLGLEEISLPHPAPSNETNKTKIKNTFTFINGELFKKLKDATTLFGISTTRSEVHRYRHSRHQIKTRESKEVKKPDGKHFRCDRDEQRIERFVEDATTAVTRSLKEPGANSRGLKEGATTAVARSLGGPRADSRDPKDDDVEDSFENVFLGSNESAKGSQKIRTQESSAATNRVSSAKNDTGKKYEDYQTKKTRTVNSKDSQRRENLQHSASRGKVDAGEDILYLSRTEDNEEREHFLIEDGAFGVVGVGETNDIGTPSDGANNLFDNLPNFEQRGEAFSTPTYVPNSSTKMTEYSFTLTKNGNIDENTRLDNNNLQVPNITKNKDIDENTHFDSNSLRAPTITKNENIDESTPLDDSLLAVSVVHMLRNCAQRKYDEDTDDVRNSSIQPSQTTKKVILRDSKLKVRGPFDDEFALKPTNKTFVNYLWKRSTGTKVDVTNSARVQESFPESDCLPTSDVGRHVGNEMTQLTLKTNEVIDENPFSLDYGNVSPGCRCSCHKIGTENVRVRESLLSDGNFDHDEIQSSISKLLTPALNQPAPLTEGNSCFKSVLSNFPFTPYVASPYFAKSASPCEGEDKVRDILVTNNPHDGTVTNECRHSPVLRVLDDFSFKTLKKKMKYKKNCKMLSTAGAIDVPNGMMEASRSSNRKSLISKPVRDDFHEIVKPYSVKNHYTLDDDGQSCLRVFPHLRKNDRPMTNFLTIPEELNSFFPFTKSDLRNIRFLAQMDRKFLLTIMHKIDTNEEIIVIFDQHAVDERIRLEQLFGTYADKCGVWKSTSVNPAIYPDVTSSDLPVLRDFRTHFEEKGLYFKFNRRDARSLRFLITVVKVPTCLHSKAMRESSPSDFGSKLTELVESLMKEMVELLSEPQYTVQSVLPETLCGALNYEACRGAIKFGDELSEKVCASLLKKLSNCEYPFQCAHGRPLLAPMVSLTKIETFMARQLSVTKCSAVAKFARLLGLQRRRFEKHVPK